MRWKLYKMWYNNECTSKLHHHDVCTVHCVEWRMASNEWPLAGGSVTPVRGETLDTLNTGLARDTGTGSPMADCGLSPQLTPGDWSGVVRGWPSWGEREETTDTLRHCQPGERQNRHAHRPADWECEMWVLRPGRVRSRKIRRSFKKALITPNRWETWSMRRFRVTWRSCPNTSELLKAPTRE